MILANIDWINGVVMPLIMSIVCGLPLALLGTFVAARYLEFNRLKTAALIEFTQLSRAFVESTTHSSDRVLDLVMHNLLQASYLGLASERQFEAAALLKKSADTYRQAFREKYEAYLPMVPQVKPELNENQAWTAAAAQAVIDCTDIGRDEIKKIARIRPNIRTFFKGAWLDLLALIGIHFSEN